MTLTKRLWWTSFVVTIEQVARVVWVSGVVAAVASRRGSQCKERGVYWGVVGGQESRVGQPKDDPEAVAPVRLDSVVCARNL